MSQVRPTWDSARSSDLEKAAIDYVNARRAFEKARPRMLAREVLDDAWDALNNAIASAQMIEETP